MPPDAPPPSPPAFYGMNDPAGAVRQDGPATTPSTVILFKAYAALMLAAGLAVFALGLTMLLVPTLSRGTSHLGLSGILTGTFYAALGTLQAVPCLVALFAKPKPWVWTFDMIIVALGMVICYCWPLSIPLLIYWTKPEVKAHFGAK
ncbi:MAG: hypothetical protein HY898_32345 [Deltaproteobacteria bacterium]|nr:hypothetical protein [Deltaproteobacteria bacterium]